jgi:hypothetical protein
MEYEIVHTICSMSSSHDYADKDVTFEDAFLKLWEFNDLKVEEIDGILTEVLENAQEYITDKKKVEEFECFCEEIANLFEDI